MCNLQEYESQSSPESKLVKDFDLLEMVLQAHEYEELEGTPGRLQEFFDSTSGKAPTCPSLLYPAHTQNILRLFFCSTFFSSHIFESVRPVRAFHQPSRPPVHQLFE